MAGQKIKILIAEDDAFIAEMYFVKLEASGFEVISAENGNEALKKFDQEKPEVVLLDIIMPEKNGWEVLEALRMKEEGKNVPIIILTNLGDQKSIDKALKSGANDYLVKSLFTPEEVVEKVKGLLAK